MYSPEELVFQKRYAFAQLLRHGVTTALPISSLFYRAWGETAEEFAAAADAAAELGLRVYLGPAYRSGGLVVEDDGGIAPLFDEARGLAGLDDAIRFCRDWEGRHGGLVRTMLAPDRIETCTPELLRRTADAARELQVPVRLHCCQSRLEYELVLELRGMSPAGVARQHGLPVAPHAASARDLGERIARHHPPGARPGNHARRGCDHCPLPHSVRARRTSAREFRALPGQ